MSSTRHSAKPVAKSPKAGNKPRSGGKSGSRPASAKAGGKAAASRSASSKVASPKPAQRKPKGTPKSRLDQALPVLDRVFGEIVLPEAGSVLERAVFLVVREGHPASTTVKYMAALKEHFIDWNEVRASRPTELSRLLLGPGRVGVSTHRKLIDQTRRLRELLEQIYGDRNDTTLEFLLELKAKEQFEYLSDLEDLGVHNAVALVQWLSGEDRILSVTAALAGAAHKLGITDSAAVGKVKKDLSVLVPKEGLVRVAAHLTQLGELGEAWPPSLQELLG